MPLHTVNFTLTINNRKQMRDDVIALFTQEQPGTGKGVNSSRYVYIVENFQGYDIQLCRPAMLNKGFDFTVKISGLYFKKNRRYNNPSHQDIVNALMHCKQTYQNYNAVIIPLINSIFNCQDIPITTNGMFFLDYSNQQHPIEIILLALKWLFIEQDFTYWNNSGRFMLYDTLKHYDLV